VSGDEEYEQTVEALNSGDKLPDVRRPAPRPPTPELVVGVAMIGMFTATEVAAAYPQVAQVFPLGSFLLFCALTRWARRGR
jgi:hypothetical protein